MWILWIILYFVLTMAWLVVLNRASKPATRVIVGLLTLTGYTVGAVILTMIVTQFQVNSETTGIFKGLTQGLVEITQDEYDPVQFHDDLIQLNEDACATYETWKFNEEAARDFLKKYNLDLEDY
ncbi:MAG: hypothetical protein R3C11_07710 [Planctomycetaceae bacterium]